MSESFIHPQALCESGDVADGTWIGPCTFIPANVKIGKNCTIGANVSIGENAEIGQSVTVRNGAALSRDIRVGDDVYIGPNAAFANTRLPGTSYEIDPDNPIILGDGAVIGAGATIAAGVSIGTNAVVDTGAVVTQRIQPNAIVAGNPAKVVGFTDARGAEAEGATSQAVFEGDVVGSIVRGVKAFRLPFFSDPRGNLSVGEFGRTIPFKPARYFVTFDVPGAHLRGEHAHKECDQFLVCIRGSCALVVDDGEKREEFKLDRPTFGVYVPQMIWSTEYKHSSDSALLVFASHHYDPDDYIRDYGEFIESVNAGKAD